MKDVRSRRYSKLCLLINERQFRVKKKVHLILYDFREKEKLLQKNRLKILHLIQIDFLMKNSQ